MGVLGVAIIDEPQRMGMGKPRLDPNSTEVQTINTSTYHADTGNTQRILVSFEFVPQGDGSKMLVIDGVKCPTILIPADVTELNVFESHLGRDEVEGEKINDLFLQRGNYHPGGPDTGVAIYLSKDESMTECVVAGQEAYVPAQLEGLKPEAD